MDSSVFIAWIKGEYRNGVACRPIVEHILGQAARGDFKIGVSTLVLVEVHKTRTSEMLTSEEDDRILQFFEHSYFEVIDLDRDIAEHANRICRQFGLKPNDAIHVASALRLECDVLLYWDDDFKSVHHSDIRCEYPEKRGQLPLIEDSSG